MGEARARKTSTAEHARDLGHACLARHRHDPAHRLSVGSGLADDPKPFNPKSVTYEIFGPPGAVATINYLNLDAEPQIARDVTLPWSLTLTTTAPAAAANIVAQGDSDTIGCRITVDDVVKDERVSTGVSAQTFCIVKSG